MLGLHTKTDWKYFRIEALFFLFIAYGTSLISDLEYSFYEEHNIWKFVTAFEYRAVIGTFSLIFYSGYYWGFLKRFVFQKKGVAIIASIICFILLDHLYNKYIMYWSISKMGFVSDKLRLQALKEYTRPHIYFTINYLLSFIVLPLIGFAFLIRSMQQDEQMKALKEQQLLSELNYLKAQIHPHFFFNTINNIYSLALKQSAETAPLVAKLGEMMRYILYEADQKTVLLTREIMFLTNYISVEKIRHHLADNILFDVQGITGSVYIEPLLLLPFIENAFKHGLQEETTNGFINIIICMAGKELTLEVGNSKPASPKARAAKGIGLQNVIKRLDILYPDKYNLDIKNNENAYHISLTLQIA